jgi:cytochrome c oxidase cbb3-type subunit 3
MKNEYEENAVALNDGKRLFQWFNCVGCHAQGGGGMGPPLMDEQWIYGSEPDQIFATIVEGRPNGMPSFRGKIPDYQVWQLAGYVRSLSRQVAKDVAPGRNDSMSTKKPEQSSEKKQPVNSSLPKSAEMP